MTNRDDTTILLRMLMDHQGEDVYDPDSHVARANLERILAAPTLTETRRPARTRRLALAAVPITLAAGAVVVGVASLNGSRTGIAEAAVISRAAAALEQPDTITYLQIHQYSAPGRLRLPTVRATWSFRDHAPAARGAHDASASRCHPCC